ncbi:acyl carrier protein [Burkholderia pyrrocinia]|uniref:Acyl carrier protein n=1 Tax=Burkholderia pyrrocinia TaxID=60550 RepID=A0A318I5C8_BURPY|nr:acyl carrier protein [Burkholderia pyrrocinia]SFW83739.1 Acyl carrier protein [Burkholderia sp. NFACC33-1]SFY44748.1 Acyl carrier protein [Burkholderia sp. NFPP32]
MKNTLRHIISDMKCLDVPIEVLADHSDLYAVGLTSLASVQLMMEIEREFRIRIPDSMLKYELFSSIDSLAAAITRLQHSNVAGCATPTAHTAPDSDSTVRAASPASH